MKRDEALIEVFGNDEVVESQLFGDFVFEGRLYFFLEESIVSASILRKSSWEKLDTMVDSSLEMEAVVLVVAE